MTNRHGTLTRLSRIPKPQPIFLVLGSKWRNRQTGEVAEATGWAYPSTMCSLTDGTTLTLADLARTRDCLDPAARLKEKDHDRGE